MKRYVKASSDPEYFDQLAYYFSRYLQQRKDEGELEDYAVDAVPELSEFQVYLILSDGTVVDTWNEPYSNFDGIDMSKDVNKLVDTYTQLLFENANSEDEIYSSYEGSNRFEPDSHRVWIQLSGASQTAVENAVRYKNSGLSWDDAIRQGIYEVNEANYDPDFEEEDFYGSEADEYDVRRYLKSRYGDLN